LKTFENKVLRSVTGLKEEGNNRRTRKLRKEKFHNMYLSNAIGLIKLSTSRRTIQQQSRIKIA